MVYTTNVFEWGGWDENEFFMPRPCMLNCDGTLAYYLDPNDYTKKVDGSPSDIGNDEYPGYAMMEWGRDGKKIWYKVVPNSDWSVESMYISNFKLDNNYYCHESFYDYKNNVRDHFYTPIYNKAPYIPPRMDADRNDIWLRHWLLVLLGKTLDTDSVWR